MTPMNDVIRKALNFALGTVFELDDTGVTVLEVHIDSGLPTITVDRQPPAVKPGHMIIRRVGNQRVTLHVVAFKGCRVQWQSSEQIMRGAA